MQNLELVNLMCVTYTQPIPLPLKGYSVILATSFYYMNPYINKINLFPKFQLIIFFLQVMHDYVYFTTP